jgi:hypothetical protein
MGRRFGRKIRVRFAKFLDVSQDSPFFIAWGVMTIIAFALVLILSFVSGFVCCLSLCIFLSLLCLATYKLVVLSVLCHGARRKTTPVPSFLSLSDMEIFDDLMNGFHDCPVCLEPIFVDRSVVMPCMHKFHFFCVNHWLQKFCLKQREHYTCPVCRTAVTALAV